MSLCALCKRNNFCPTLYLLSRTTSVVIGMLLISRYHCCCWRCYCRWCRIPTECVVKRRSAVDHRHWRTTRWVTVWVLCVVQRPSKVWQMWLGMHA